MKTYILLKDIGSFYKSGDEVVEMGNCNGFYYTVINRKPPVYWKAEWVENTPKMFMGKSEWEKIQKEKQVDARIKFNLEVMGILNHCKNASIISIKPMDKKIKGYKVPYDLFQGILKKGDILSASNEGWYFITTDKNRTFEMPKEWVETWEAVYEEEKEFTKSDLKKAFYEARFLKHIEDHKSFRYNSFKDYYATLNK